MALESSVLALCVTVGLFVAICCILRSRGAQVVALACSFVALLVTTQLLMRVLCRPPYNYKFPGLVTGLHFLAVTLILWVYWCFWMGEAWRCLPFSVGRRRYFRGVLPIAISQPVSVLFNNKAMVFVGAGVVAIIGTLAPVSTAVLSRFCGRKLSVLSWAGVVIAFSGGLVISWSEIAESTGLDTKMGAAVTQGLIFAFLAVVGRSTKIVLIDQLISPEAYADEEATKEPEAVPPLHLYVLQFPLALTISLAYTLLTEDPQQAWEQLTPEVAKVISLSCVTATGLNFVGLYVLKEFGASAQQIIGKLNTLCIASLSVAFLGERLPLLVFVGSSLVLAGVAVFERGVSHASVADADSSEEDEDDDSLDDESMEKPFKT